MEFHKHYTRDEARELLPEIRRWLAQLVKLRSVLEKSDAKIAALTSKGYDAGGKIVNDWVRCLAEMKGLLFEFHRREIQVKDLDRGLIDFPAMKDGNEVFLCWEDGEDDIDYWHDLEAGYAGRQKIEDD